MNAAVALLLAQAASSTSTTIKVEQVEGRCRIAINGQRFDVQHEELALNKALAALPHDQPVTVMGGTTTPYRCIGGAIYTMQVNGVGKIGFISEAEMGRSKE